MINFDFVSGINFALTLIKVFFLVVSLIFTIFLIIVYRQFNYMDKIIKDLQDSPILKSIILLLLFLSVSLFLTALVIL